MATSVLPAAGPWAFDKAHTTIGFVVRHMVVSKVRGSFGEFDGRIHLAEDLARSQVEVHIAAASITTGVADRDRHLTSPDFLDVVRYPTIDFVSTGITGSGSEWQVTGDLTIRGVTRPITLDATYHGLGRNPWGQEVAAFTVTGEIDREAYGMTWNQALEAGGVLIGKTIKVEIEIEANPAAA